MFIALKGATDTPCRRSQRQIPVVRTLFPASELAPGQWVDFALSRTVHMPGILLLVYVSALMFVMRHFAGPLVHKLSPVGLLAAECLAEIGAPAAAAVPRLRELLASEWSVSEGGIADEIIEREEEFLEEILRLCFARV